MIAACSYVVARHERRMVIVHHICNRIPGRQPILLMNIKHARPNSHTRLHKRTLPPRSKSFGRLSLPTYTSTHGSSRTSRFGFLLSGLAVFNSFSTFAFLGF